MKSWKDWLIQTVASLAAFVAFLGLWQLAVSSFGIHPITLPAPGRVLSTGWEEREPLSYGFLTTGAAAALGLLQSILVGSCVAVAFSQSKWLRRACYPYVVFLQTVPIVAIAPLLITWFGYEFRTVVFISSIISLFPIISNVTAGLISIDKGLLELFQMARATRWQTLWKLRIPFAISNLILGCRVSAGLAVIGAIIGEVFVGPGASGFEGLGTLLTAWQNRARTDAIIANIFVSTLLGLVMLGFVNLIANVALKRWTQSRDFEAE